MSPKQVLTVVLWTIFIGFALAGCSGSRHNSPELAKSGNAPGMTPEQAPAQPRELSLKDVLAEIDAAQPPEGIALEVYEMLCGELARVLQDRHAASAKVVSAAPEGEENTVEDLYVQESISGNSRLFWTYVNLGDYDQNGEANIADVTPIGLHFGMTAADPEWPAARLADGDGNGEVNISDITPLGVHYLAATSSYRIYGSDSKTGPWDPVDSCPLPPPPPSGPVHCEFELASDDYEYYQVRPADGQGTEGTPSLPSTRLGGTAQVEIGQTIWFEETDIGQEGGTVEGSAGSALEGFKVEFAMGSLKGNTHIRFGINDGLITPSIGEFYGPIVALETGDQRGFPEPITMTFPYEREHWSEHPVFFGFNDDGRLQLLNEGVINPAGQVMQLTTFNSLKYFGALFVKAEIFQQLLAVSTKYIPSHDGFQVVNKGTGLSPGGECFGFSSFSSWYYYGLDFSESPQRLHSRFMYPVGYSGYTGQDIVTSRAHTSVARMWDLYSSFLVVPQMDNLAVQRFMTIATAIGNSGTPVVIYLNHTDNSPGAHAVVGYAFDATGIDIYDPNAPGDNSRRIPFNGVTLGPYGTFDGIYYCGPGALFCAEAFGPILADAEEGFNANGHGNMWFWSHEPMEEVYAGYVRLRGYVDSVSLLVDEMWVGIGNALTYDYNLYKLPVASNGAMDFTVPIQPGINIFFFDAYGTKIVSPPKGYVPLDLLYCPDPYFRLVGDPTPAVISVVLTWETDGTDLDLIIVDPTGDYSWPVKPNTADGGELSINDSNGYGPECWALRTNDTVRWGQQYKVRVHYNNDHGHGATAFSVKVVRHEATANQTSDWYSGFIIDSNTWAFDPVHDSGSDWRDVCVVVP